MSAVISSQRMELNMSDGKLSRMECGRVNGSDSGSQCELGSRSSSTRKIRASSRVETRTGRSGLARRHGAVMLTVP